MKSLTQFILENIEFSKIPLLEAQSKVTVEWMEEHYQKYNKELFNNELPEKIELGIITNKKEDSLGCQGFRKAWQYNTKRMRGNMYEMFVLKPGATRRNDANSYIAVKDIMELEPYINMSPRYNFSDFQKEDTMIHEMIHLWVHKDGLSPKRSHGKEFKRKCDEIRKKAEELYGKKYQLETYAKHDADEDKDFQYTEEVKLQIEEEKKKQLAKGGGICLVYLELDKSKIKTIRLMKYTKRFFFCTRKHLPAIIKRIEKDTEIISAWVSDTAPEYMFNKYGKFSTSTNYNSFWPLEEFGFYPLGLAHDVFKKGAIQIKQVKEGLIDSIKKFMDKLKDLFIRIPKDTAVDNLDLDKLADDLEDIEDVEIEKSPNDKHLIELR